jgi:hypothetical protein
VELCFTGVGVFDQTAVDSCGITIPPIALPVSGTTKYQDRSHPGLEAGLLMAKTKLRITAQFSVYVGALCRIRHRVADELSIFASINRCGIVGLLSSF